MDKSDAKKILRLYRPGTPDDQDPQFTEALNLARQDAELAQWLAAHSEVYLALRAKLKQIPVPADLQQSILRRQAQLQKPIARPNFRYQVLAAAAVILLCLALGFQMMMKSHSEQFAACRERVVKQSQRTYAMSMTSTNLDAIRSYLLQKNYPDYELTKTLAKLPGEGCATLDWHNRKVSMVCLNGGKNKDLYLFVLDRGTLRSAPDSTVPEYVQIHRLMTASWSRGDKIYILAGPGGEAELKQYLN